VNPYSLISMDQQNGRAHVRLPDRRHAVPLGQPDVYDLTELAIGPLQICGPAVTLRYVSPANHRPPGRQLPTSQTAQTSNPHGPAQEQ
jgi:hypothetical protein